VNDEILLEYKRVLGRLGGRRPLIGKIVNLLREEAELVPATALPNISPDPGDDPFCACTETGLAAFIVTLNPKHFSAIAPVSSRDQTRPNAMEGALGGRTDLDCEFKRTYAVSQARSSHRLLTRSMSEGDLAPICFSISHNLIKPCSFLPPQFLGVKQSSSPLRERNAP
jgi:hypothetical protein